MCPPWGGDLQPHRRPEGVAQAAQGAWPEGVAEATQGAEPLWPTHRRSFGTKHSKCETASGLVYSKQVKTV